MLHSYTSKFLGCVIYLIVVAAIGAGVVIGWLIFG